MQSSRASIRAALALSLSTTATVPSVIHAAPAPTPSRRPSMAVWRRARPGFVPGPADEARLAAAQAKRERRAARNLRGQAGGAS